MHRVEQAVGDFLGLRVNESGVVAVSGGADSVALLRALLFARRASADSHHSTLTVAHLNHQLRGDESDGDEEFVRQLACTFGVRFLSTRIDASKAGGNLEDAARRARYAFFAEVAADVGAEWIATGHTADDQAETVLHRLLRGTGLQGLRGIARIKPSRDCPGAGNMPPRQRSILRPLLRTTRAEIMDYLNSLQQLYRTDSTNADSRFTRNRIRAELLPLLKTFNTEIVPSLGRLAVQADEAYTYIEGEARDLLNEAEKPRAGNAAILDRAKLANAPRLLVGEVLRHIWQREGWPLGEMDFDQWAHAVELKRRDFPGGITMQVRERVVQLGPRE